MTKKWFSIVVLLLVLVGMLAVTADAKLRPGDPRIEKARLFKTSLALEDGRGEMVAAARGFQTSSLGSAQPAVDSRGALIAQTWRDWQSNSSIGRTVDVNRPGAPDPAVQFSYMEKASAAAADLSRWGWASYEATSGTFVPPGGKVVVQSDAPGSVQAGSYPKIAIDATGTAFMGSYDFPDQAALPNNTQMHVAKDGGSLVGDFGGILDGSVMSEAVRDGGGIENAETIWPTMDIYENGAVTTVYLAAFENVTGADGAVKVFRKVGWSDANPDATWSLVFTDTTFFPTQDISCSRVSSRVGVAWPKFTPAGRTAGDQSQNDVHCALSPTGASGSWVRTNITNYAGAGYRAWLEVACLFDSSDKFHVIWNGSYTDGVDFGARRCRLFHWSEHNTARIYTIFDAGWDPTLTDCVGGSNVMNVGKFSIAECDGRLYAIFTAWNWPGIDGTGAVDDCCASAAISQGANGELYLSISSDLSGNAWDAPRNLSSSYAPACDTGNCVDDRWASISRYGMDDALWSSPDWSNAVSYDFGTGYAGTKYLQVWYQTDRYPGGGILATPQGPLTNNDMRWIRLACITPVPAALLSVNPGFIAYPEFTKPGFEKQYTLTLENTGNTLLTLNSVTPFEDSAKPSAPAGWLGYSGAPASIAIAGSATMTLELNNGGIVDPADPVRLFGHLAFNYGPPTKTLNFPIEFIVADTIVYTEWDSVTTLCGITLTASTNGNMGNNYLGGANMGFPQPAPECDTSGGTLNPGDGDIYMGDASPVIVKKNGTEYVASWAIFSNGFQSTSGFKPLFPGSTRGSFSSAGQYDGFNSGTFCTSDSLVKIEKTWWAPLNNADSCKFIIQRMRVFPYTIGLTVPNLAIGEAFDWDIPSDTGASNSADIGGTWPAQRMVYMRGFRSADTAITNHACYNNGLRYGGSALIAMHLKNCIQDSALYAGYNAANDSFVYPASGFVPAQLWANMQATGYSNEARITDLHSVLVYKNAAANVGFTLPANDTLTIWTAMAVVRPNGGTVAQGLDSLKKEMDKAFRWYKRTGVKTCPDVIIPPPCCLGTTGNVNDGLAEAPDLSDLSLLIAYLTQTPKPTLPCPAEANVNGSVAVAPDLSDLSLLIAYLTQTPKPVLPNCPA
jgi:hypothetical protein